ncbi:MAG: xylulokinase [Verrucomicrobiaceae bacterium]|nr:xylulokinase [Verrucomicrobiaceae bacterium]
MIFLGIDSGTQSTKAIALDFETGDILANAQKGYDLIPGLPAGHLEQNPSDWLKATEEVALSCIAQLGSRREEVAGIGVSGQQHGLVVLDANDQVIRPAKLWCDTSTSQQCGMFESEFGGASGLIELSGNAILPGYTIPKLLWLKQNEPESFAKVSTVLLPHDYINFWLTGVKRMEYGDASGTGVLDIRSRRWCDELLDFVDPSVRDMFPDLGSSLEAHGQLRNELAGEWGLSDNVMVSAGGGDNMMGAIGTGNVVPGVITASLGTSGTLYGVADKPAIDSGGEVAAFCDSTDRWLPLVCTMNVTVVTEQIRKLFELDLDELENAVARSEPGAAGISFLPYLNGERTPNLPNGSGVIHGLRVENMRQSNLARAAMEGATLGLAYGLEGFRGMGITPSEIRLTGGGSNSGQWRQIAADVFNTPVVMLSTAEGAGLGAAIQAAYCNASGAVGYSDLCSRFVAVDETTRCEPDSGNVSLYRELLERQRGMTRELNAAGRL